MVAIKLAILIAVFSLMGILAVFTYRYLNNKLLAANHSLAIILLSILLFVAIGSIFTGAFVISGLMIHYLAN